MKTAFITGITGQDAAYMAELLLSKGYKVYGGMRRTASGGLWRLQYLGIKDQVEIVPFELMDKYLIERTIRTLKPDEVYNFAAMSFVGDSFSLSNTVYEMDFIGVLHLLEAIKMHSPKTKFYQASSSEMFGKVAETPQSEKTPFRPRSKYGIAKLAAHWEVVNKREADGLFAVSGICFNHESPLRGVEFVTMKIATFLKDFAYFDSVTKQLELGNLEAKRDWGHAKDYVRAMYLMMHTKEPGDYVIATGKTHSVREFIEIVCRQLKLPIEWKGEGLKEKGLINGKEVIVINPKLYRPSEVDLLKGNSRLARKKLAWKPAYNLEALIEDMLGGIFYLA